jgi:DNA-binding LytR/AlgR family response regulator
LAKKNGCIFLTKAEGGEFVKVRIEMTEDVVEDEVIIRCAQMDEKIQNLHHYIVNQTYSKSTITFYKDNQEFYISLEEVLFFETEGEYVYGHTNTEAYRIKHRLYELEQMLPKYFVRTAKSTIVNSKKIRSITRNLTTSSLIQFAKSHKEVYVSRYYYKDLRKRMNERNVSI